MQINRVGYFLIALFGGLGLAMCIGPALFGANARNVADHRLDRRRSSSSSPSASGSTPATRQRKAAHNDWIFRNGIKGTATVVEVGNSHTTVNEMPLMKLTLDARHSRASTAPRSPAAK